MAGRTIFAVGGLEDETQRDSFARYHAQYIRDNGGKARPCICILPQAQAEKDSIIQQWMQSYNKAGCDAVSLLTFKPKALFADIINAADAFMVPGGSTINMMAIWHARGITPLLRAAYDAGKSFAGYSAGGMCWFDDFITSDAGLAEEYVFAKGLGWLKGSFAPHYMKAKPGMNWRPPEYTRHIAAGRLSEGYGCDDGAFVVYNNETVSGFGTVVAGHAAYSVTRTGDTTATEIMETVFVG